jgi:hypothetical protein
MTFSPKLIFWLTLYSTIGSGIAGGTIHLTGLIPTAWIAPVTGWTSLITVCVLSFLTLATGYAGTGKGPLAGPPTREEARDIMTQAGVAAKPPAPSVQVKP